MPHTLDTTDKNSLIKAQENDPSLHDLREKVKGTDSEYTVNDRVLYRLTTKSNKEPYMQIIIPTDHCENIIRIAHSTMMAGHSGYKIMKYHIMKNFVWPGMSRQIREACQSCDHCLHRPRNPVIFPPCNQPQSSVNPSTRSPQTSLEILK